MARLKTAQAIVSHRGFRPENWSNFVDHHEGVLDRRYKIASKERSLVHRASEILGEELSLDKYLLTHCSIVASVDTVDVPNVKLGMVEEGVGRRVNRLWRNYRITPETEKYINNNQDSFPRDVLLAAYPTFIGAQNFQEHLQLIEHSKGRIIDAVARDIGESVYIDILVATNRKHAQLIQDIESGILSTLSMGCHVTHTQCSKCGNVAIDETDLCPCQRYERGNTFIDELGHVHRVAELCGNKDLDHPTKGVKFIEASWVKIPAFTGAVKRNIIAPEILSVNIEKQARQILSQSPSKWVREEGIHKAAFSKTSFDFGGFGGDSDEGDSDSDSEETVEDTKKPLEDLENEVEEYILDNVRSRIQDKIRKKNQESAAKGELAVSSNDNLKTAHMKYATSIDTLMKVSKSHADFLNNLALINKSFGIRISTDLYRTVLQVGPAARYDKTASYIDACRRVLGRRVTGNEAQNLVCLGQILSRLEKDK